MGRFVWGQIIEGTLCKGIDYGGDALKGDRLWRGRFAGERIMEGTHCWGTDYGGDAL